MTITEDSPRPAAGYAWARSGVYMSGPDVLSRVPFNRNTLARMIDDGRFPSPLKVGTRRVWLETVVEDALRPQPVAA